MNTLLILLILVLICIIEYPFAYLLRKIAIIRLQNRCKGKLVLTYDDGPGERVEQDLIHLLNKYNAKATFFLNAKRALDYPKLKKQLINSHQEVACHTYKHHNAWKTPPWIIYKDIENAYNIMDEWINTPNIIRPPYGKITTSIWISLLLKKITVAFWTIDSEDTYQNLPPYNKILKKVSKNKGGVILMHSFDRTEPNGHLREEYVINLTQQLLRLAQEENLEICYFSTI